MTFEEAEPIIPDVNEDAAPEAGIEVDQAQEIGDKVSGRPKPASRKKQGVDIDDLLLPKATVGRLIKKAFPNEKVVVQREAFTAMNRAATMFVSFLAHSATQSSKKRTIKPTDVYAGLADMEFESFVPRVEKMTDMWMAREAERRAGKTAERKERERVLEERQTRREEARKEAENKGEMFDEEEWERARAAAEKSDQGKTDGEDENRGEDVEKEDDEMERAKRIRYSGAAGSAGVTPSKHQQDEEDSAGDGEDEDNNEDNDDEDDLANDPNIIIATEEDIADDDDARTGPENRDMVENDIPVEDLDGKRRRPPVMNPDYAGDEDEDEGSGSD